MQFPGGRMRALTLSYDDGVQQDARLIEILDRYGIKCTFNLNGSHLIDEERSYPEGRVHRRMARREALEVYTKAIENGHEVATHGFTHPFLDKLPSERVAYEIAEDRKALENMFGRIIKGHAYPYGTVADHVVDVLRGCGILYARTTVATKKFDVPTDWLRMPSTCHHKVPELMELVDRFLNGEVKYAHPRLFYLWGHSFEFEENDNWEIIERFAEAIGNREDVWYANNIQIYEYVKAYNSLEFSIDGRFVHNPSALTVWFSTGGVNVTVEAGETVNIR